MKSRFLTFFNIICVLTLCGCTSLQSITRDTANKITPIPQSVKDAASAKVDFEKELYGLGAAFVGDSGLKFATSKATTDAKNQLRSSIRSEANMIFNSFALDMDSHTRRIYDPIFPDLVDYVVENEISKSKDKGHWDDGNRAYVLVTTSRTSVFNQCKVVFKNFTDSLTSKISNVGSMTEKKDLSNIKNKNTQPTSGAGSKTPTSDLGNLTDDSSSDSDDSSSSDSFDD